MAIASVISACTLPHIPATTLPPNPCSYGLSAAHTAAFTAICSHLVSAV